MIINAGDPDSHWLRVYDKATGEQIRHVVRVDSEMREVKRMAYPPPPASTVVGANILITEGRSFRVIDTRTNTVVAETAE